MRIDWDSGTIKRDIGIVGSWSPPGLLEQEQGRQQWPREKCQWGAQRFGSWPARNQSINECTRIISYRSIWRSKIHSQNREQHREQNQQRVGLAALNHGDDWSNNTGMGSQQPTKCINMLYIYTYTNKYIVRGRVQKEIYRRLSDMVTLGSRLTISNHTQEW